MSDSRPYWSPFAPPKQGKYVTVAQRRESFAQQFAHAIWRAIDFFRVEKAVTPRGGGCQEKATVFVGGCQE